MCRMMGIQKNQSVSLHLLGWFLISILLTVALVLPVLTQAVLVCNFCPLDYIGKPCVNMTTECAPGWRCFSAKAYYGTIHLLSRQGCMAPRLCGSHEMVSHLGVPYNISYTCCCKDKCNKRPKANKRLIKLLGFGTSDSDSDSGNQTDTSKDLWDSCTNFTTSLHLLMHHYKTNR
ncbi:protein Bouncer [Thalassophryne amazonica]|uniref:protein Bouncer n=1 Tax=Thalassophryne amazonica TaxID=390379 RepID=UPI0014714FDF|nr:protein Bouncer [Thalassophryne amazonica]